jgi:chorismate lyase/3-hydroxybenzoate synthase
VPPDWVEDLLGEDPVESRVAAGNGVQIRSCDASGFLFLKAVVVGAVELDDVTFRNTVEFAYSEIGGILGERRHHPLRFWNYVPGIGTRIPTGLSRYEVFNAGRYLGYQDWFGREDFEERLPAASAVGHRGGDLVIHVLAGDEPGRSFENPRQKPAYRYSPRYGPLPPCFSRATLLGRGSLLEDRGWEGIVAGTASVVGEDTHHPDDLEAQLRETYQNLACVSAALAGETGPHDLEAWLDSAGALRALARYLDMRVYVVREGHHEAVVAGFREVFSGLRRLEVIAADLCRPDLLVEAEGTVALRS